MISSMRQALLLGTLMLLAAGAGLLPAGTVALWLFDEPIGAYPSSILNDPIGRNILALGRGARIAEGKFGRALEIADPAPLPITSKGDLAEEGAGSILFGLRQPPIPPGRKIQPLWWGNATFAAIGTAGEAHLRKPKFANPSRNGLNLGAADWTIEFWYLPQRVTGEPGTIFEIGSGPRGENDRFTRLSLSADGRTFVLEQRGITVTIPTALAPKGWQHLAFTYSVRDRQLRHYVGGVAQPPRLAVTLQAVPPGDEAYVTIGRDGTFRHPLCGRLDEMRVSDHVVYAAAFRPPGSFSLTYGGKLSKPALAAGPPLLFGKDAPKTGVVELGSRKHLFIDDALVAETRGIAFVPNPPVRREKVFQDLRGHLSVVEDEAGLIRIYYRAKDDALAVATSRDGVTWEKRDSIAVNESVGLGNVFIDPNAPPEARWKYFSGVRRDSMFVYSSRDGWQFTRHETSALPFAAGSQSVIYYDDQRRIYAGHHRSDYGRTRDGKTQRRFLLSETRDLLQPWSWQAATPERTAAESKRQRIKSAILDPWFLDNGPLSPSGLGIELPVTFTTDDQLDPPASDVYTTKVFKYPWAPDTYLAFPAIYFHYEGAQPRARSVLGDESRRKGSGVVEVQLAVSRDGLAWKRYPRPAYVPINSNGADAIHMMFMTLGMVKRGDEIWQYSGGHAGNGINYHSAWVRHPDSPLWRFVQRMDGFVAAEAAYTGGSLKTRPLRFDGKRLLLNIDTGATGYAQVGLLDESGKPIPGYAAEDCVYINGDFLRHPVEWLGKGTDVSALAGRVVQLEIRMRAARLFAMQFTRD